MMHDGGRRRTSLDDSVQRSRRRRTLGGRPARHGGTARAYLRNRRSELHRSVARWVGLRERISETGGPNSTAAWHGGWDCASVSQKPAVQTPPQRGTVGGTVRAYLRNRRSKLHCSVARWVGLCERISETGGPNSTAAWHGGTAPMAESAPVTRDG